MQYTENYSMNKPQFGENALVTKLNENADTLDTLIYNTRQMQADSYDSTQTYNTGDLVSYNSALYICLADNVTGTWDSTKWSATTLSEQVELAKQSGGGQVTKEASGNPIELTDAANAPLVKCVTEIQGSQDLHGYDKPWVGGAGKNKLPMTVDGIKALNTSGTWSGNVYSINGATIEIETDGDNNVTGIKLNGVSNAQIIFIICDVGTNLANGTYILNGCPSEGSTETYYLQLTKTPSPSLRDTGSGVSFEVGGSYTVDRCRIVINSGITLTNLIFYPMIRLSTVTDPTFEPYSNICPITAYTEGEIEVSDGDGNVTTHTTTYPSAIYRGSEDVVNGEVTSEWVKVKLKDLTWTYLADYKFFYATNTGKKQGTFNIISDCFKSENVVWGGGVNEGAICGNLSNSTIYIQTVLYDNVTDFVAWLTTLGAECAFEMTPTTSSVTPTNLPIRTLSGYNHIESSTGDMDIEYITQDYQPLVDLIQSNKHVYSTQEQIVGTWVDGKDIYEKTFELQSEVTLTSYQWNSITGVSLSGVETPISAEIRGSRGTSVANVDFMDSPVSVWGTSGTEKVKSITFRYTKSTTTRSLSTSLTSQKAQIEPLTDNTEEVSTEEEKAVNEEENTNENR